MDDLTVTFQPKHHGAGPWTLTFRYEVIEDRLEWIGLVVERAEGKGTGPLTHQALRGISYTALADEGRSRLLDERPHLLPPAIRSRLSGLPAADEPRSDHYAAVTNVYLAAWRRNEHPRQAVAEHFGVEPSTASNWIRAARDLGLISKTTPGKPSGAMVYAKGQSGGTSGASADTRARRTQRKRRREKG